MDSYTGAGLMGLAMGGLSLLYGVLFRSGALHANWASQYRNEMLPRYQRNGVFTLIPFGLMFLVGGALLVVHDAPPAWLVLATVVVWVVGFVLAMVVLARPPRWMKPRWLREAEADGWRHYTKPPFRVTREVLMVTSIVLVLGGSFVLMLVQATRTEAAGALIVGLGVVALYLLRRRGSS
jgi:hypothetical protein